MSAKDLKMPQSTFKLGGRERVIRFDLNAFAILEEKFGSIEKAFEQFESGSMTSIRDVIWAGLLHDEATIDEVTGELIKYNITPFQVGSWIDPETMESLVKELFNTLNASLPEDKKEELQKKVDALQNAKNDQTTQ